MWTLIITTMARMIVTETMKMIRMMVNGTLLYWCNKKLDMISC